jgi:3-deoxy-7-phosphoheptulonate synthase
MMNGSPRSSDLGRSAAPAQLAGRASGQGDTVVDVNGVPVGGSEVVVMAGPCLVEDEAMLLETARFVAARGARILRGAAYKPRTSPYSFQGLGEPALRMLEVAGRETGLRVVCEVLSPRDVELVARHCDMLQVGSRSMQNFALLHEVGRSRAPVLLKRGMSATIEEWLLAAEHVLVHGNEAVVLCERGVRGFETLTRFTLDLSAVPLVRQLSHLPVVVDPSHGTGLRDLVRPMSRAAVAAGAQGLLVEVHPRPDEALSDAAQSLDFAEFDALMCELRDAGHVAGPAVQTGRR